MKDYYRILGVTKQATANEIKQSYRRLASQYHPDKGGDTARFQEIQEAYAVLGDEQKRREYDNPRPQTHFNFGAGMPGGMNLDDIFNMFGAGMRQSQMNPRIQLWITLEDVARGGPRPISLQIGDQAATISIDIPPGISDGDTIRYPRLSPNGQDLIVVYRIKPDGRWQREGRDVTTEKQVSILDLILGTEIPIDDLAGATLMLKIPPGTQPGSLLRMRGRGLPASTLPGRAGGQAGDLLVRVQGYIPTELSNDLVDAIRRARGH